DLKALIAETQFVAENWDVSGSSYIREYLRQRDWGRDEPWTEMARRLFNVFHGLYLIPFREQTLVGRSYDKEGKLPSPEQFHAWLMEDTFALEDLPQKFE